MFEEDLNVFFDTADFAVKADFSGTEIDVIFDTPTQSVTIYDTDIEADAPHLKCKTSDIKEIGPAVNSTVTVEEIAYKVKRIVHDGTGVSAIYLKT